MMKAALVLITLGPVSAMAGPMDAPIGVPAADAATAQVPEGDAVDRTKDAVVKAAGDGGAATAGGGNPLWTIPLSTLRSTRDRPLFSASRRSLVLASPSAPPHEEPPPPPQAVSAPLERPQLSLVGTIVGSQSRVALLKDSGSETLIRLHVGQENSGWRVRGIDLHSITVEKGGQAVVLDLPKPE